MTDVSGIDSEAIELSKDWTTPLWVAEVIKVGLSKDPVDALLIFKKLADVFDRRNDLILNQTLGDEAMLDVLVDRRREALDVAQEEWVDAIVKKKEATV
tara:strand:- start:152 stop:448 length:297 start_codon:yes stop_codon:yes gene_type:complete